MDGMAIMTKYVCPDCELVIYPEKRQNPPGPCPVCGTEMEKERGLLSAKCMANVKRLVRDLIKLRAGD